MGETKLQKNLFTVMMCFGMVFGMTLYNIILHNGFSAGVFTLLVKEIWLVFIVAFILDYFVVGPIAKKQVFSILKPETKKVIVILSLSTTMVVSMVLLMSIFGSVLTQGFTLNALKVYPKTVMLNFAAALPLNLLIVSPVVRMVFVKIFPPQTVNS
ncbi:DUF2798 domain-containing protein [Draconibacterium sp. IB214405]|uniref:DUF2798 domain-containing protein n=1 Tax=Draconibacterium sp. IB214405 TaxID=3097352 RepID=UPI002A139D6F|nr:DUF2798 domain-containing protein [Draconibacterium sp. IB214405]MDX8340891.1 DUF2798 domain-containing protein [Draconibacterium sp. IB214405]